MVMDNSVYNCADYRRLSKEDLIKKNESESISNQGLLINSFAKNNNLNIVKTYIDDGYSGANFDRPGFEQLIEDIESGLINCVITKDLSRIGRELYKTGIYIEEYFREKRVRYIAINDSYDSLVGDSMLGVKLSFNDLYLRDQSKKVRSSFRVKQEKGDYIGSFAKYGYMKDPKDHHHLIIDPEASKIVKLIYSWFLEGLSLQKICDNLTESKVPIPIVYKKEPRGLMVSENDGFGVWRKATIRSILKSELYIGNMVQRCFEKLSYNNKKLIHLDEKEWCKVENTHDAIIDKETFEAVQKKFKERSFVPKKKNIDRFLLSGLLYCGNCGHTLGISEKELKTKMSRFTYCNYYSRKGKFSNCSPNRIDYNKLESDILYYLQDIASEFIKHYNLSELVDDSIYLYNSDVEEMKKELEQIDKQINSKKKIIYSLYNDRLNEVISVDTYKELNKNHENELQKLKKDREELERKLNIFSDISKEKEFFKCRDTVEKFLKLEKPTKKLINNLINKVVVYDKGNEKEVQVYFNFKELTFIANGLSQ